LKHNDDFKRSGNPGYMFEKPVIGGRLVTNQTEGGVTKQAIELEPRPEHWFTLPSAGTDGTCWTGEKTPVLFGVDVRSGCSSTVDSRNVTESCQLLQISAADFLLSGIPEYVATFGNPNVSVISDWVPVLWDNKTLRTEVTDSFNVDDYVCSGVLTSVNIEIAYSLAGSIANPQPRIVGVLCKPGALTDVHLNYVTEPLADFTQHVPLYASVTFIDVTKPPLDRYAKLPKIDVHLPNDFFYPFLNGVECALPSLIILVICQLLCLFTVVGR